MSDALTMEAKKKPAHCRLFFNSRERPGLFFAVLTNRFDGAAFQGFHAKSGIFFGCRLFVDERVATLIMAGKKPRSRFTAKVAIDALLIDVKLARSILGPFVRFVGHNCREQRVITSTVKR